MLSYTKDAVAVLVKGLGFLLLCAVSWLIVIPMLLIVGGSLLLVYAAVSLVADAVAGRSPRELDLRTAREVARRLCTSA